MKILKYFLIIFASLIFLLGIIQALFYLPIISFIPSDVLKTVTDNIVSEALILLGIPAIVSLILALLFSKIRTTNKKLAYRVKMAEQLLDISTDLIYAYNLEGTCVYINKTAYEARGYTREMLKKVNLEKLDFADFSNLIKPRIKELEETSEILFESKHLVNDNYIPVQVYCRLIVFNEKKLALIAVHDISHKKKSEEELKRSSEKLQRAMEGTIQTMALTAEVRDPYTAGHQQRVAKLAVAIAREMNFSEDKIECIHVAGTLHDIGKIYMPAEILSRPGKLRQNEFNLIKDHAEIGSDLLKNIEFK